MEINNAPLLTIENLSIAIKDANGVNHILVKNINLTIQSKECLALVGESGSGKTLTALSILKLLDDPRFVYPSGSIYFEGLDLLTLDEKSLQTIRGNQICMIFQDPMASLNPLQTIEKQLKEVLFIHRKMNKKEVLAEIISSLKRVGLKNAEQRLRHYPHQFSEGERQRIMIAMAILTKPKLLIADEPTTELDVSIQAQIIALLQELKNELGMSILFISHNLPIVKQMANRIAVMKQGKIVEMDYRHRIFLKPSHPYTIELIHSSPIGDPIPIKTEPNILLKVRQLNVQIKQNMGWFKKQTKTIVDHIRLNVHQGECVGLIGESGSGKTTTALAILRLIQSTGRIKFDGKALDKLSQKALLPFRSEIQIVFQDPFSSLNPKFTVQQLLEEGLLIHSKLNSDERLEKINLILKELELSPDDRSKYPHEFSGGQRQRIAIARVLILEPKLIILDEPTSSLDLSIQSQIIQLLKKLQLNHSISYLLISHDLAVIHSICHHILVMQNGKIIEQGTREQIFHQPQHEYTKLLLSFFSQPKKKKFQVTGSLHELEKTSD